MTAARDVKIGTIILAAGASTRLGSPKQLLRYRGESLLRRAAREACALAARPVVVVLGSEAELLRAELAEVAVELAVNPAWARGMGTSIRAGVGVLLKGAVPPDGVLLMVCDQPLVGATELGQLTEAFHAAASEHAIAAARYAGTLGVPAIFGRAHFAALREWPDGTGAKALLGEHHERVIPVEMPGAATDIDTQAQYAGLLDCNGGPWGLSDFANSK